MAGEPTAAELIRTARRSARLTQRELAARLGLSQSVLSAYESGLRQPSFPMLAAVVAAAGQELHVEVRPRADGAGGLHGPLGRRVRRNRSRLVRAAARHGARNVRVFGSVARGDEAEGSDADFLVDLPEDAGLLTLFRIERDFEALLGSPVDVVPADAVRPSVKPDAIAL